MMKSFLLSILCVLHLAVGAQPVVPSEQELIDRSNTLMSAVDHQDRATLEGLVAEEFRLEVPGDMAFTPRAEWIDNAVGMDWSDFKFHNVKVHFFGDVAVVSSLLDFKINTSWGLPISSNTQVTDVWVRRDGEWKIAVRQLGAASISSTLRMVAGFIAGMITFLLIRLVVRRRRRAKAKRNMAAAA